MVIAAAAKVLCKYRLWLIVRVNKKGQNPFSQILSLSNYSNSIFVEIRRGIRHELYPCTHSLMIRSISPIFFITSLAMFNWHRVRTRLCSGYSVRKYTFPRR